jgi:hypothetical protein
MPTVAAPSAGVGLVIVGGGVLLFFGALLGPSIGFNLYWGRPGLRRGRMVEGWRERLLAAGIGAVLIIMGVLAVLSALRIWPFALNHPP